MQEYSHDVFSISGLLLVKVKRPCNLNTLKCVCEDIHRLCGQF